MKLMINSIIFYYLQLHAQKNKQMSMCKCYRFIFLLRRQSLLVHCSLRLNLASLNHQKESSLLNRLPHSSHRWQSTSLWHQRKCKIMMLGYDLCYLWSFYVLFDTNRKILITRQVSKKVAFSTKQSSKPRALKWGIRKINSECSLQKINEEDLYYHHHRLCHLLSLGKSIFLLRCCL